MDERSKASEFEGEILAAARMQDPVERIDSLEAVAKRALRAGYVREALIALGILRPTLESQGLAVRARAVDKRIGALNQRVVKRVGSPSEPNDPVSEALRKLNDRTTSPTCVYLAVDMEKALKLRPQTKRVARLQGLKRKARRLGCETTTMKGLELLRDEFSKPRDRRRLARVLREIDDLKKHMLALVNAP